VEELKRPPNIVFVFPVKAEKFKIASPFGGLIYIYVCISFLFFLILAQECYIFRREDLK
jgi:hypothetical protein